MSTDPPTESHPSAVTSPPLAEVHGRHGATWSLFPGVGEAPAHYGSSAAEHEVLSAGCGLLDRSFADRLEISGEDRQRFLNGQVTCDLAPLEPGQLVYGFFTSRQGKVEADVTLLALEESFRLELPPGRGAPIREHLEKYILVDRVTVGLTEVVPISLVGPGAEGVLSELGLPARPEPARHVPVTVAGVEVVLARHALHGAQMWTLWPVAAAAAELWEALVEAGARPVGYAAFEALRVERGEPRFGADFGPDHLPQETGIERAVSFTKGCYLGQEVVARIHYRGQVNRSLQGLRFDTDQPPAHGTPLLHDGRPVGSVGTALRSPALDAVVGLAILHRRGAEPGTELTVEGGGTATVAELPLVGG